MKAPCSTPVVIPWLGHNAPDRAHNREQRIFSHANNGTLPADSVADRVNRETYRHHDEEKRWNLINRHQASTSKASKEKLDVKTLPLI